MSKVLLLTHAGESAMEILPSLSLLDHTVRMMPASADNALSMTGSSARQSDDARPDALLVDARRDLVRVKELLRQLAAVDIPVIAVISEGAWAAVSADWASHDVILNTAGPGEVEARIRLAIGRSAATTVSPSAPAEEVRSGELVIDEATYSAKIRGVALDLTFKEFELLKFLAQHPRRVFTRSQLLQEVWGYDYFGGTRTVDVHVRRLRAKLGTENESLIGTVRNVGYKFVPAKPGKPDSRRPSSGPAADGAPDGGIVPPEVAADGRGGRDVRDSKPGPEASAGNGSNGHRDRNASNSASHDTSRSAKRSASRSGSAR